MVVFMVGQNDRNTYINRVTISMGVKPIINVLCRQVSSGRTVLPGH